MQPKVVIIVQARTGSTRLPGKVLKPILSKPLLFYVVERLKRAKIPNEIVIATTENREDDPIIEFCVENNIPYYRGSENNVLSRYYYTAFEHAAEVIVRITSDCPLIDPQIVDETINVLLKDYPKVDYVSNTIDRCFPRGLDVEVFTFQALKKAYEEATSPDDTEHVTPYIYSHPKKFKIKKYSQKEDHSAHRWTVDTLEDFELISLIISELYPKKQDFTYYDIVELIERNPAWKEINAHINQKEIKKTSKTKKS